MSVSAVSAIQQPSANFAEALIPQLPSENAVTAEASSSGQSHLHMFEAEDDSPSFGDLLDVINPLQHIPIINDIYREVTGDKIGVGARLVGGALFGGPLGLIGSAINAVMEEATGHDIGGHLIALFKDDQPASSGTALASASNPAPDASSPSAEANGPAGAQSVAGPSGTSSAGTGEPAKDDGGSKTAAKPMLLPDIAGGTPLAQAETAPPPAPPAVPQAPVSAAPVSAAPVSAVEGKPMPLWGSREPRMMPVPPRTTPLATKSPPALGMATSNTSSRSNTPVVGARTYQPPVSPAMVQEMAATQANTQAGTVASNDWFSGAMMQGLAKYERNSKLGQPSGSTVSEMQ